jgi:hypothetical protein
MQLLEDGLLVVALKKFAFNIWYLKLNNLSDSILPYESCKVASLMIHVFRKGSHPINPIVQITPFSNPKTRFNLATTHLWWANSKNLPPSGSNIFNTTTIYSRMEITIKTQNCFYTNEGKFEYLKLRKGTINVRKNDPTQIIRAQTILNIDILCTQMWAHEHICYEWTKCCKIVICLCNFIHHFHTSCKGVIDYCTTPCPN